MHIKSALLNYSITCIAQLSLRASPSQDEKKRKFELQILIDFGSLLIDCIRSARYSYFIPATYINLLLDLTNRILQNASLQFLFHIQKILKSCIEQEV